MSSFNPEQHGYQKHAHGYTQVRRLSNGRVTCQRMVQTSARTWRTYTGNGPTLKAAVKAMYSHERAVKNFGGWWEATAHGKRKAGEARAWASGYRWHLDYMRLLEEEAELDADEADDLEIRDRLSDHR